jgi:hypothetical protein
MKYTIASIIFILLTGEVILASQYPFVFEDKIYRQEVQTVLLYPADDQLAHPILMLSDPQHLKLSFDVLGDMAYVYQYTFIHCTFDWKPSELRPREYLEGYDDDQITDYRFSLNTLTPYVHHSLTFPTTYLQPKISGNYILVVYEGEMTEGNILLTRRFMVADPKVGISARVPQHPRNPVHSGINQQLDVEILAPGFFAGKPVNAFQLVIRQNSRWDNAVVGLKPSHIYNEKLTYEYIDETVFEGGNQWRNFDMKSYKYQSERIQRIITEQDYFTVRLWEDERRNREVYKSEIDIFGRKLIQARQDQETDIEGDYAWVEFFLKYDAPLTHGEMYVIGALNDWNLDEKNRMNYNFGARGYEVSVFLKQGYYNYMYGIREKGKNAAETELIEGSHWDTLNEYLILFYYRQPGTSHDQLIATALINSH